MSEKANIMERKIGEIFEFGGEWYQCMKGDSCGECSLFVTECGNGTKSDIADEIFGKCSRVRREDGKHAIFKKLEKVGTPFSCNYYGDARLVMMQEYQLFDANVICCYSMPSMYITDYKHKRIAIEIKQNKEGMEEKKVKLDKLVTDYTSNKITYKEFEVEVKMLYTDKEGSKPNLKPFDIEAAKAGKPVCTRDGSKARIICFDYNGETGDYPIVALVHYNKGNKRYERVLMYTSDGLFNKYGDCQHDDDLMMLPEKKEGWVNVYKERCYESKGEAISCRACNMEYIDTIRVEWEE